MNSNENIENRFKKLLKIKNANEKIRLNTEMIHLNIMNELAQLMEHQSINKTQLAEKLNVSKSYITQLFTADKILNLKLISQIQDVLNVAFGMTFYDEYMVVVPFEEQPFIKILADKESIPIKNFVQNLLDASITYQKDVYETQAKTLSTVQPDVYGDTQRRMINSTSIVPTVSPELAAALA